MVQCGRSFLRNTIVDPQLYSSIAFRLHCVFEFDTPVRACVGVCTTRRLTSCVVPVVGVLGLGAAPPDVGLLALRLGAFRHSFLFGRAADELHPSETVDPAGEEHPVVVEVHGAVAAGLLRTTDTIIKAALHLFNPKCSPESFSGGAIKHFKR